MALDSFFAQSELLGDVAVGATFDDATDDLELTRGEAVRFPLRDGGLLHQVMQSRDEIDHALAANPVVAGVDGADSSLQVAGERVFEHDAARTDVERFNDLLRGDSGRK